MTFDPRIETLATYPAREFKIECLRCRRGAVLVRHEMQRRFGNIPLIECARLIAAAKGCALAKMPDAECSVDVFELPIWVWARLREARDGKWQPTLTCRRRYAGMKSTESCPGVYHLDLDKLIAALGDDYPLDRLHSKAKCPRCQTEAVDIEWTQPDPPKEPAPAQEKPEPPLGLRPSRAAIGRKRFGIIEVMTAFQLGLPGLAAVAGMPGYPSDRMLCH